MNILKNFFGKNSKFFAKVVSTDNNFSTDLLDVELAISYLEKIGNSDVVVYLYNDNASTILGFEHIVKFSGNADVISYILRTYS